MMTIDIALILLVCSGIASSLESFDRFDKNSRLTILPGTVKASDAEVACESVEQYLPTIENDLVDLLNMVGHWKLQNVLLRDHVYARVVPSLEKQNLLMLIRVNDDNHVLKSLVCSKRSHNNNYSSGCSNVSLIILYILTSTILMGMLLYLVYRVVGINRSLANSSVIRNNGSEIKE